MAIPVTWRNVAVPDYGSEYDLIQKSSELLGKSLKGIGTNIADYGKRKQDTDTAAFIADLSAAADDQERSQMIADASDYSGFLDMKEITARDDALQLQEYAAADEERKVAAETQLRSLDPHRLKIEEFKAALVEQEKGQNDLKETRAQAQHELEQLQLKANTKLTNTQRSELRTNIKLKRKELSQYDRELQLGREKIQSAINLNTATGAYYGTLGSRQLGLADKDRFDLKEQKRLRTEELTFGKQLGNVQRASQTSIKAGLIAANIEMDKNLEAFTQNPRLQEQVKELIRLSDISISDDMLKKAGILLEDGTHNYTPGGYKKLKRLFNKHYGGEGSEYQGATSKFLNIIADTLIEENDELTQGFIEGKRVSDLGVKGRAQEIITDRLVIMDKKLTYGGLDHTAKTALIDQYTKELADELPRTTVSQIEEVMRPYRDELFKQDDLNLTKTVDRKVIVDGKEVMQQFVVPSDLAKEFGLTLIDLRAGQNTYTDFSNFESKLMTKLGRDNSLNSPEAIGEVGRRMLSEIPGYSRARKQAEVLYRTREALDEQSLTTAKKLHELIGAFQIEVQKEGDATHIVTTLRKKHGGAYSGLNEKGQKINKKTYISKEHLQASVDKTLDIAYRLYKDKWMDPKTLKVSDAARAAIAHAVYKVYAASSVETPWYEHYEVLHPKTQSAGVLLHDFSIDQLDADQMRTMLSPYLPNAVQLEPGDQLRVLNLEKPSKDTTAKNAANDINSAAAGYSANQPGSLSPNQGIQNGVFKTADVPRINPAFKDMSANQMWELYDKAVMGTSKQYASGDIVNQIYLMYPDEYKKIMGTDTPPWNN